MQDQPPFGEMNFLQPDTIERYRDGTGFHSTTPGIDYFTPILKQRA